MKFHPRHQCLVYKGSPSLQLRSLSVVTRQKLEQNHRCFYLNSPAMVAGMRSYLAAEGVDVLHETSRSSLIMSSERSHLIEGKEFSPDRLIRQLEESLEEALRCGYVGLWATGDMTWELGPYINSARLLEYEWRLEAFMRDHPQLGGICQYHVDTLPFGMVKQGLSAHSRAFVNDTLSLLNPAFVTPERLADLRVLDGELDSFLEMLLNPNECSTADH